MNKVFKSETYRLLRSKEVWAMLISLFVIQAGMVAVNFAVTHLNFFKEMGEVQALAAAYKPGFFTSFTGTGNGFAFRILIIIMLCSLVTKLYQNGINKQLVSCGISRNEVVLGQFFSMTAVFSAVTLLLSVTQGFMNVIQGGGLGLEEVNTARLLIGTAGMLLEIGSIVAMFLLVTHLTGSMGAAIALGLGAELGLSTAVSGLAFYTKCKAISDYYLGTVQSTATNIEIPLKEQLTGMGALAVYIVLLLVLTQIVFTRKEIK